MAIRFNGTSVSSIEPESSKNILISVSSSITTGCCVGVGVGVKVFVGVGVGVGISLQQMSYTILVLNLK